MDTKLNINEETGEVVSNEIEMDNTDEMDVANAALDDMHAEANAEADCGFDELEEAEELLDKVTA